MFVSTKVRREAFIGTLMFQSISPQELRPWLQSLEPAVTDCEDQFKGLNRSRNLELAA